MFILSIVLCFSHAKILVAGGAGYIGSHTCVELLNSGYDIVVVDSLINSKAEAVKRVEKITGKTIPLHVADLRDYEAVKPVFEQHNITCVIHFASLKAVGESMAKPLEYYDHNLGSTITLMKLVKEFGVKDFVFSSSAVVYGNPDVVPVTENSTIKPYNPYGSTKVAIENMLKEIAAADPSLGIVLLRYFNPAGSHASHTIGEDPNGIPNNLFPYITQVAVGKHKILPIFGNDYDTPDGYCIRDFIHVVDLAKGHEAVLKKLKTTRGVLTYNLSRGKGISVLEILKMFIKVTGVQVPYKVVARRAGDAPVWYASAALAEKDLGWKAKLTLEDMCRDHWLFQKQNPNGYDPAPLRQEEKEI